MQRELEVAKALAEKAGQIIRDRFGTNFATYNKASAADFVTEVDRESQKIIVDGIAEAFPSHRMVAEEQENLNYPAGPEPTWYVDPLDGTTNFVYGIPFFAVSIALADQRGPLAAVVYDPLGREMFTALKDKGAFLNGRPIIVDQRRSTLAQSLLVTGYPVTQERKEYAMSANIEKIVMECVDLRALGSAALELAYIACGRLTGYWEVTLRPWDLAAGMLLVTEAGGMASDLGGQRLDIAEYMSIAASNGKIHRELIETLGFRR